jgi:hypothetical protein
MIRRAIGAAMISAACVIAGPGVVLADAAGPTDYRSEVVAIDPATPAVDVTIEGGDAFVRIAVAEGHEVVVLGYAPDEEPYLRIGVDGAVEHNLRSFATYYNEERFGGDDIPAIVDNSAPPDWQRIGDGGRWAWHDHRAHWMGTEPPIGLEPGDSLPSQSIPILVDGARVEIEVRTTLQDEPSIWPALFGILVGLQVVFLGALLGPATTTLASLVLSVAALVVGVTQFRSLPAETGPLLTWWLLPAIAVAAAVAIVVTYGRSVLLRSGLLAFAAALLVVWAFRRRSGLSRAVLPTDLPFWLDRCITAAVLAGSVALLVLAVRDMFRVPADGPLSDPQSGA